MNKKDIKQELKNNKTPLTFTKSLNFFWMALIYTAITILAVVCLIPFVLMMINATRDGHEIVRGFTLIPGDDLVANWKMLTKHINLFRAMLNSLIVALPCTLLSSYFSAITGYALAVYKFIGNKLIFAITVVFMMIPGQLSLLGFYELVKELGMIDTYWPLILPSIASCGTVFFLRQYVLSLFPKTLLEAARIDGAREITLSIELHFLLWLRVLLQWQSVHLSVTGMHTLCL